MKKLTVTFLALLALLSLLALACNAAGLLPVNGDLPQTSTPTRTALAPTATRLPSTATPTLSPSPFVTPTWTHTPEPTGTPDPAFSVWYHPDHALYAGDQVSMEIIAPPGIEVEGQRVTVSVNHTGVEELGPVEFQAFGIEGRMQATLWWAWDTRQLEPGSYTLTYSIEPGGYQWQEEVVLNPSSDLPPPEPEAAWASAESECCTVHYITGTEAERDLEWLLERTDDVARQVSQEMGVELEERITLTLLPRVLGHGGFAGDGISVSYLDRNYAGSSFEMVLHHEMVHILDGRLGGELRPTLLVEGLAVYLSGGHFKQEDIFPRAAALLEIDGGEFAGEMGWYQPLEKLVDNFYPSQHEIGYLQSAAWVEFLVDRWGWEAFNDFYRDIHPHSSGSQAQAIDSASRAHFKISLSELEEMFLEELRRQEVTEQDLQDLRLTVEFYESVRRYQKHMDPSAYFMTAWLPDREEMRERGITADFVRRPSAPANILMEEMLVEAHQHLLAGRYEAAQMVLGNLQVELEGQALDTLPAYEDTLRPARGSPR